MTVITPPTLQEQVEGAKLVVLGRLVFMDMVDGSGNQTTGRTGPGSPNRIRHHIAVDEVVYQHTSLGSEAVAVQKIVVPQWGMWHSELKEPTSVEGKPLLYPLRCVDFETGDAAAVCDAVPAIDPKHRSDVIAALESTTPTPTA